MSRKNEFVVKSEKYVYVPDYIYNRRSQIIRREVIPFTLLQVILNDKEMCEHEKLEVINGISSGYKIKPESERVCIWRKKDEHIASFEENVYLRVYYDGEKELVEEDIDASYLSRGKAADILGDDFNKFEIVK